MLTSAVDGVLGYIRNIICSILSKKREMSISLTTRSQSTYHKRQLRNSMLPQQPVPCASHIVLRMGSPGESSCWLPIQELHIWDTLSNKNVEKIWLYRVLKQEFPVLTGPPFHHSNMNTGYPGFFKAILEVLIWIKLCSSCCLPSSLHVNWAEHLL